MAINYGNQLTFGMWSLQELLDPTHDLVKLADLINWEDVHDRLALYYSLKGRQGLPIRLMVGLHILKHKYNMSDEKCADRVRSDLYWMYFCGMDSESLKSNHKHLNSATMTKFRNRIGDKGFAEVEDVIRKYLITKGHIDKKTMSIDSTCHPKNIAHPGDSKLLDHGRKLLLKGMKKLEGLGVNMIKNVRTYSRKSKKIIISMAKFDKDRQTKIKAGSLELAKQARHVLGKCEKMLKRAARQLGKEARKTIAQVRQNAVLVKQVIYQTRQRFKGKHVKGKVYSLHEPGVIAIKKGKFRCPSEYGSKLNLSVDKNGFVLTHETYASNANDTTLLEPALRTWEKSTGNLPKQVNADRGYSIREFTKGRMAKIKRVSMPWKGKKTNPDTNTSWFRRGQKLRAQIEGVIGHLKLDHRMDRCRYSGVRGDRINASLAVTAWNLTKLCRTL